MQQTIRFRLAVSKRLRMPAGIGVVGLVEAALLLIGIVLRLRDYLACRSLWLDEAMLARNLVDRSMPGLFRSLDYDQCAPVGFLLMEKLACWLLGPSEYALRLPPLLLGIWSLLLFANLTRRLVLPAAGLGALALFVFTTSQIFSTCKQYPVDVWAAVAALTLAHRALVRASTGREHLLLAVAGIGLVWLSHPAALVLAGCGGVLFLNHLAARQSTRAGWTAVVAAAWLAGFATQYLISVRSAYSNSFLTAYWIDGFPPHAAGAVEHCRWLASSIIESVRLPVGLTPCALGLALIGLGAFRLLRSPFWFGLLCLPLAICLMAAEARLYPFRNRLISFLVPCYLLLVAAAVDGLFKSRFIAVRVAGWAALAILVYQPVLHARHGLREPPRFEETRPVLDYVSRHAQSGDIIFIHPSAEHTFAFYRRYYPLDHVSITQGALAAPDTIGQIQNLPADKQVWILCSITKNGAWPVEPLTRQQLFNMLASQREELDSVEAPGVTAFLFSPRRGRASHGDAVPAGGEALGPCRIGLPACHGDGDAVPAGAEAPEPK